jgi:F0F1-type ATP synthase gamma subunit
MKITVKAKVTDDSKNKPGKIESEFQNYQVYLQSGSTAIVNLYSATKQQAQRALNENKTTKREETVSCNSETGFSRHTAEYKIRRRLLDQDSSISELNQY